MNINQGKSNSIEVFEIKVITGRSDSFSPRGTWSRRHFSDERVLLFFNWLLRYSCYSLGRFGIVDDKYMFCRMAQVVTCVLEDATNMGDNIIGISSTISMQVFAFKQS